MCVLSDSIVRICSFLVDMQAEILPLFDVARPALKSITDKPSSEVAAMSELTQRYLSNSFEAEITKLFARDGSLPKHHSLRQDVAKVVSLQLDRVWREKKEKKTKKTEVVDEESEQGRRVSTEILIASCLVRSCLAHGRTGPP